jgi:hypothetical protein
VNHFRRQSQTSHRHHNARITRLGQEWLLQSDVASLPTHIGSRATNFLWRLRHNYRAETVKVPVILATVYNTRASDFSP